MCSGARRARSHRALIVLIGALHLHLFPAFHASNLARLNERPWVSLGYGLLHYVAIVPLAGLLLVTLIGILFLPVYFVLIGCLLWLGYITSAVWVGGLLLRRSTPGSWLELLLGLALFQGMALIPLPTGMISATLVAFGAGAVLQVCYRGVRRGGGSRELPPISHPHPA